MEGREFDSHQSHIGGVVLASSTGAMSLSISNLSTETLLSYKFTIEIQCLVSFLRPHISLSLPSIAFP